MDFNDIIKLLDETVANLKDTMRRKSSDYTGGKTSQDPFANFNSTNVFDVDPIIGIMIRVLDKMQRIRSFVKDDELQVPNESVDDAFDDMIGYTILAKALMKQRRDTDSIQKLDDPASSRKS